MSISKTNTGLHVAHRDVSLRTPQGSHSSGIYIERADAQRITLFYAGDDAVKEENPGFELPVEPALLRELAKALNRIAKEARV
jgi:hypothetical protein